MFWYNKKSPANANRNAQQRCMCESPVKQSLRQAPEGARRPAALVFFSYSPQSVTYLAQPTPIGWKSQIFSTLSHLSPRWGWPLSNLWKSFTDPVTRVFQAADGEDLVILACTVFDWCTLVTDGQTDGQTNTIAMAKTRYSSSCCCA